VHGFERVREYQTARAVENQAIRGFEDPDCFHNGHDVLKCVGDMHRNLLNTVRKTDFTTESILGIVDEYMLRPRAQDRLDALPLFHETNHRLGECIKKIEELEKRPKAPSLSKSVDHYTTAPSRASSTIGHPSMPSRSIPSQSGKTPPHDFNLGPNIRNIPSVPTYDISTHNNSEACDPFSEHVTRSQFNRRQSNNPFFNNSSPTPTWDATPAHGANSNVSSIRYDSKYNANPGENAMLSQNPFRRSLPIVSNGLKNEHKPPATIVSWNSDGQIPHSTLENEAEVGYSGFQQAPNQSINMHDLRIQPTNLGSPVAEQISNDTSQKRFSAPQRATPQWKVEDALKWRTGPDRHKLPTDRPDTSELEDRDYVRYWVYPVNLYN
jgi:hypothetical protein